VYVAAGASTTVLVIVIGVTCPFIIEEGEIETGPDVAVPASLVVELSEVPMMEAVEICMHPFGEHRSFFGQHPPPVSAEH
jgi:hypothetical protein